MKGQRDAVGVLGNPRCTSGAVSVAGPYNTDTSLYFLSLICQTIPALLCLGLMQFDIKRFHRNNETKAVKLLGCAALGTLLLNSPAFSLPLQPLTCKRISDKFSDDEYLNITS